MLTTPPGVAAPMRAAVLVLVLLAPLAGAASAPVTLRLDAADAITASGLVRLDAEAGVLDVSDDLLAGAVEVRWTRAHGYDVTNDGEYLAGSRTGSFEPRNTTRTFAAGALRVTSCLDPCVALLVLQPGSRATLDGVAPGPLAVTGEERVHYVGMRERGPLEVEREHSFRAVVGPDWLDAPPGRLDGATLHATGRIVLFLDGPAGTLAGQPFWSGNRTRPGQTLAGVPVTEENDHRFLALMLDGAEVRAAGLTTASAALPRATLATDGALHARGATGVLRYGETRRALDGDDVEVQGVTSGPFRATRGDAPVDALAGGNAWSGRAEGEATLVTVDGSVVSPIRASSAAASTAARWTAGAILLWLLAKAWAWAAYSRLDPRSVLDNENRRAVLEALAASPGARPVDLSRATGVHEAVVRYHLRRLQSAGLARCETAGDAAAWVAATSKPAFPPHVLVALRGIDGGTARRLAEVLAASPGGQTQVEVSGNAGVSRRLAAYHLARLERASLVTRQGRPAVYQATPLLRDALRADEETRGAA